jgi:FADH2 O2-dependent halogenase
VLRFANGVTSAGVAAVDAVSEELRFAEGAAAWERLLARLPSLGEEFAQARVVGSFHHARRLPFLSAQGAGARWALLPSAAGFVDPLLSTGFPLTLLGVSRLARGLEEGAVSFEDYARRTAGELQSTARLVGALYAAMGDAELFGALARLYFAAASFTETMRRLGRGGEAGEAFLLAEHRVFGPRCVACVAMALARPQGAERARLLADIREAIAPVDLAGLGDATRRNWHPCRAEDLFAAAERIGATRAELEAMLARTGFGGQGIGEDR